MDGLISSLRRQNQGSCAGMSVRTLHPAAQLAEVRKVNIGCRQSDYPAYDPQICIISYDASYHMLRQKVAACAAKDPAARVPTYIQGHVMVCTHSHGLGSFVLLHQHVQLAVQHRITLLTIHTTTGSFACGWWCCLPGLHQNCQAINVCFGSIHLSTGILCNESSECEAAARCLQIQIQGPTKSLPEAHGDVDGNCDDAGHYADAMQCQLSKASCRQLTLH